MQVKLTLIMKFPERLLKLRNTLGLNQTEMSERLGLSMNYVSSLEREDKHPSDAVRNHVSLIEEAVEAGYYRATENVMMEDSECYNEGMRSAGSNTIAVVSWAHAGEAESFEELPASWQKRIPTNCPDPDSFALSLKGDSMEPQYLENDDLILMPNKRAETGDFVVCRFKDDGILLRKIEAVGDIITLIPINQRYNITTHKEEEFEWIYPLWGMQRSLMQTKPNQ